MKNIESRLSFIKIENFLPIPSFQVLVRSNLFISFFQALIRSNIPLQTFHVLVTSNLNTYAEKILKFQSFIGLSNVA